MKALIPFVCGLVAALAIAGVGAMSPTPVTSPVQFKDVTAAAGIHFKHNAGKAGKKYLPETMGAGVAIFDYNGDGKPDILFVNSKDLEPHGKRTTCALYRNNGNGTFADVTAGSGLDIEVYGIGVSTADYDNDGREDIYITALEGDHLFHNEGNGKFRDVTQAAGIQNANFGTSAAWLDYDHDGRWISSSPIMCSGQQRATCSAPSMAPRNPTAPPSLIKGLACACSTISAMA